MKYIDLLILVHALIWLYVIFGSLIDKNHAKFIIFLVIPLIYLIQMLPVHIFTESYKAELKINTDKELKIKLNEMYKTLKIPILKEVLLIFVYLKDKVFKNSVFNPLSGQGMLILGMSISVYKLNDFKLNTIIDSINFSKLI